MNFSMWLLSSVFAVTTVLFLGSILSMALRRYAAWENALVRTLLCIALILPATQALAPHLPGVRWLEQQQAKWSEHWIHAPKGSEEKETPGPQKTDDAIGFHMRAYPTTRTIGDFTLMEALFWTWMVGTAASLYGFALGLQKVRRLLDASDPLPTDTCQPAAEFCARITGVPVPPIRTTRALPSPVLVGWLRPCILIPASSVPLSKEVLLHELAHLRRGDLWWSCLGRTAYALWWFHPLAWMVKRRLERSAENVCDDLVVLWTQDPSGYAEQLLSFVPIKLGKEARWLAGVAMAGYRTQLGKRISRLLDPSHKPRATIGCGGLVSLLAGTVPVILLLTALCASRAQTDPALDHGSLPSRQMDGMVRKETSGQTAQPETPDAAEARDKAVVERKLATAIPRVAFHAVPLSDALEYLRAEAQRLDTAESNPENRGINIFLKMPAPLKAVPPGKTGSAFGTNDTAAFASSNPTIHQVTLDLSQRSLKEILEAVAAQVNMKIKVERYAVSLVPLSEAVDGLVTVQFKVAPAVLGAPADATGQAAPNSRFDARSWLEKKGLPFPPGSSATYLAGSQKLVVRNTQENIERLKTFLPLGTQAQ